MYYSPLRYPGGKGRLEKFMRLLVKTNNLVGGTYVEPFAGGAGVAIGLLLNEAVGSIVINDINKSIHAFWYSVLNHSEALCEMIAETPVTIEEWARQKKKQVKHCSILELGFSTFFLNRTNRSGILTGGVIGGQKQTGRWKIDARFNKSALVARIKRIAERRDNIRLFNCDAVNFIDQVLPKLTGNTLIYFDPPYYRKGSSLYEDSFDARGHEKLAKAIQSIDDKPWVVTYDHATEIQELYQEYRIRSFDINYSAARSYKGTELMIFGNNCVCPSRQTLERYNINLRLNEVIKGRAKPS